MADVKVSGLPVDSSLDGNHYTILNDPTGPTTKRTLLSTLAAFFFNQVNIPAGTGSPVTRADELLEDAVISGLVLSGDSYGVNRNASMTAGIVYINGRRLSPSSVSARTYTASKDTYVDALDNADGTVTIVYTEVTNGAAAPALAANSVRLGRVVTGATTIAAASSIRQLGSDSLSNLFYPSRLQKITVLRQNDTTNATQKQSVILSGWGGMTFGGSAPNISETVTFGVTFLQIPIILIAYGGDQSSGAVALGNGGNTVHGPAASKHYADQVGQFTAYVFQTASANWSSGNIVYYTWIAIGEVV